MGFKNDLLDSQIKAWDDLLRQSVTFKFPKGSLFYTPPPKPLKWHRKVVLKLKWLTGFRIAHKDNIYEDGEFRI